MISIKTKRFTLRPCRLGDARDVARNINNPKIVKNMVTIPYPYPLVDVRKWLKNTIAKNKRNPNKINWVILIDNEVVGLIGGTIHKNGHKMNFGYWLAEKHWGKGIITEVIKVFTDYLFRTRKLRRVEAEVFNFNLASMRVLEKNKFKKEGVLCKSCKKGNKLFDTHLFAKVR